FYIYRLPGGSEFIGGIGTVRNGLYPGYVISSFYNDPEATVSIVFEKDLPFDAIDSIFKDVSETQSETGSRSLLYPFPEFSTDKATYLNDVRNIVSLLDNGEKTVYSRVISGDESIDIKESLSSLSSYFPNAFVFCFHTPQTGTWIGATPEKLLQSKNGMLSTVALAGTRVVSDNIDQPEWDQKNIEEQNMVTLYIFSIFKSSGIQVQSDISPKSKRVGKLEHLCTEFNALSPGNMGETELLDFLYRLSPTPALCGYPKEKGYSIINSTEDFSRAYYGGFTGPYFSEREFTFYVILRSLRFTLSRWCMYAGGGITADSIPEAEWEETCRKASSILDRIIYTEKE
ncbi:MAG: chorismate-binding protein, partial [Muribaculaceae bacterium]|nr:chorismate-binding protein [Muribaculaceae bacterium]